MSSTDELPLRQQPPASRRPPVGPPPVWRRWTAPAGALAVGLALGAVLGALAVDPTRSPAYRELASALASAQGPVPSATAVAATSIGEGVWTVGIDVAPGTYRTARPVAADCYWAIIRSGSNGADILANGIPTGGHPTVTLAGGQDFQNEGCGTFVPA